MLSQCCSDRCASSWSPFCFWWLVCVSAEQHTCLPIMWHSRLQTFHTTTLMASELIGLKSCWLFCLECHAGENVLDKLWIGVLKHTTDISLQLSDIGDLISMHCESSRGDILNIFALAVAVPSTCLRTIGDRAFPAAPSRTWNSLPLEVTSSRTLPTFKSKLKTYLFSLSFPVV